MKCTRSSAWRSCWTTPYHPQTNGLVEGLHQTKMRMIGKLGKDKKANWLGHLAEIVHAYNVTCSAVTGYSPHYLMFAHEGLGSELIFSLPHLQESQRPPWERPLPNVMWWDMMATVLRSIEDHPLRDSGPIDSRSLPTKMVLWPEDRHHVNLKPGNLVLVNRPMPLRERGRLGIGGKRKHVRWCIRSWQTSPPTKW